MKTKKVFVVKNFKSPYVEQAIIILKEDTPQGAPMSDAVHEAEAIIADYLKSMGQYHAKSHSKKWLLLPFVIALVVLLWRLVV